MNPLRKIASQTALYGVSSILGRFLNYLLVPLQVRIFAPSEFGVVTEFYSYSAFLAVVLTYGMETAFFRYASQKEDKNKVYSTAFLTLCISTIVYIVLGYLNADSIASFLHYPNHKHYVLLFLFITAFDALTAIPFAMLRQENRPLKFATLKLVNIFVLIILNLLFLKVFPVFGLYNSTFGVAYIFVANLIASGITLLCLWPQLKSIKFNLDFMLQKEMLKFGLPLMIAGLAGMINETFDRLIMKYLLPQTSNTLHDLGVYGACYKLAMLMTIFIQAYRFAAEPFFFGNHSDSKNKETYADVMNIFVAICCLIFLGIMINIEIIKNFLVKEYFEGLFIVPILLAANLFLGIYINVSMWYKLSGKTRFGIYFSFFGAAITITGLFILVPKMGYAGAAWTTLICYFLMALVAFIIGQKQYPIPYQTGKILSYIAGAFSLFYISTLLGEGISKLILGNILILIYLAVIYILEKHQFKPTHANTNR